MVLCKDWDGEAVGTDLMTSVRAFKAPHDGLYEDRVSFAWAARNVEKLS
jgi:hypothetical protein